GLAVERATRPERYIVGCAEPERSLPPALGSVLGALCCPILTMCYESAELAKLAINCRLVSSITVAHTLSEPSEGIGSSASEIAPARKLGAGIGPSAYLSPGLGIAGGNLERDLATLQRLAEATGAETGLISAFVGNSRHRRDWALRTLHAEVLVRKPDALIGVLG